MVIYLTPTGERMVELFLQKYPELRAKEAEIKKFIATIINGESNIDARQEHRRVKVTIEFEPTSCYMDVDQMVNALQILVHMFGKTISDAHIEIREVYE